MLVCPPPPPPHTHTLWHTHTYTRTHILWHTHTLTTEIKQVYAIPEDQCTKSISKPLKGIIIIKTRRANAQLTHIENSKLNFLLYLDTLLWPRKWARF